MPTPSKNETVTKAQYDALVKRVTALEKQHSVEHHTTAVVRGIDDQPVTVVVANDSED